MLNRLDFGARLKRYVRLITLVSLAFLVGCVSSIVVKPDIPEPLIQKVPLNTGLIYTDTFKDYVYIENEKKRNSLKSLDFSAAQIVMFDQVFSALTNLVEPDDAARHLTIEPEILDFQYSSPGETKLKQYEIWIKYRLRLRDKNEANIADWTIKGYGKTPTSMLSSATNAFSAATNIALRDVGAQLSTRFVRQRVVKTLLDGGSPPAIPVAEPEKKNIGAVGDEGQSESDSTALVDESRGGKEAIEQVDKEPSDAVDDRVDLDEDSETDAEVGDETKS
jgi:hypothetical protein